MSEQVAVAKLCERETCRVCLCLAGRDQLGAHLVLESEEATRARYLAQLAQERTPQKD